MRMTLVGRAGATLVATFLLLALFGPWLAPFPEAAFDLANPLAGPSSRHWLGTGENGVDLFSAILHGTRLAGIVCLSVVVTSLALGAAIGTIAGYTGGVVDAVLLRIIDIVLSFPGILLNVALVAVMRSPGVLHVVGALVATAWVPYARVARAQALSLRERDYVLAARALGASGSSILVRHVVPNLLGPLVVQASFGAGAVILSEASLSFLGLGPARAVSWGTLLDQGTAYLLRSPSIAVYPGLAIAATMLGFNLLGDALRDRLAVHRPEP